MQSSRTSEAQTVYLLLVTEDVPQHWRDFPGKDVLQQINNFPGGDEDRGAAADWLQGTARAGAAAEGALALRPGTHPTGPDVSAQHSGTGPERMVTVRAASTHSWTDSAAGAGPGGLGRRGCRGGKADVSCIITESFRMEKTLKIESNCKPNTAEESLGPTSPGWCLLQWTQTPGLLTLLTVLLSPSSFRMVLGCCPECYHSADPGFCTQWDVWAAGHGGTCQVLCGAGSLGVTTWARPSALGRAMPSTCALGRAGPAWLRASSMSGASGDHKPPAVRPGREMPCPAGLVDGPGLPRAAACAQP